GTGAKARGLAEGEESRPPALGVALGVGLALGLLAGLSGTGGGIFLSPLILLCGWATMKQTAATSSAFILVNSLAGLAGLWMGGKGGGGVPGEVYTWLLPWGAAAVVGGLVGSQMGAQWLRVATLRVMLAAVLVVAGVKLVAVW
ncbi:MAG: TSUP family transporter, partial [Phycisphaerales bacterium]|nr:TSUP family transporter [Phycisphaerales bacterium]